MKEKKKSNNDGGLEEKWWEGQRDKWKVKWIKKKHTDLKIVKKKKRRKTIGFETKKELDIRMLNKKDRKW